MTVLRWLWHFLLGLFTKPRLGTVYGINAAHPITGAIVLAYVGQTRQRLWARAKQHRKCQPWADLIDGEAFVIQSGVWNDAMLDLRELIQIVRLRPTYNVIGNRANPWRIPPWTAKEQRAARDTARNAGIYP